MRSRSEAGAEYTRMVEECALPVAPMAMPEQSLTRQRVGLFVPLFSWLASRESRLG